jgi:apolipoprotein D and lipocalin family protein
MKKRLTTIVCGWLLASCTTTVEPLHGITDPVDLQRFMGDWYVLGFIPIDPPLLPMFSEADAHNGIESYALQPDGTIATTYTFRRGAFDGPEKRFTPRARVTNPPVHSEWKMKFAWYLPAGDYLILHVDPGYQTTVIGVPDRRYLWIMARSPDLAETEYAALLALVRPKGYDPALVRKVPQSWPARAN